MVVVAVEMDLVGEDAQDFGPLGTFRRQERQESRQEGRIWSLNEYLIEDRALKNTSRIQRNERVDVDKQDPIMYCESAKM